MTPGREGILNVGEKRTPSVSFLLVFVLPTTAHKLSGSGSDVTTQDMMLDSGQNENPDQYRSVPGWSGNMSGFRTF